MGNLKNKPLTTALDRCSRLLCRQFPSNAGWPHYGMAVALVIAGICLRLTWSQDLGPRAIYLLFFPVVILAALCGGLGAGLLATLLSALAIDYFWLPPLGSIAIANPTDWLTLLVFLTSCVMISFITELMHRAEARAREAESRWATPSDPGPRGEGVVPDQARPGNGKLAPLFPVNQAFTVALALLVMVAWLSFHTIKEMLAADRSEYHAHAVIHRLDQLLLALTNAESDERIFLLTGDQKYLEPYHANLGQVAEELATLFRLTANDPGQQSHLRELEAPVAEKLAELQQTIDLRRSQSFEAALRQAIANIDRACMAHIHTHASELRDEKRRLLNDNVSIKAVHAHRGLIATILVAFLLSFGMLILVFTLLRQEIGKRTRAEARLRVHQDHLEEMISWRTQELELANSCLKIENEERMQVKLALQRSNAQLDLLAATADQLLKSESPQEIAADLCRKVMEFLGCQVFFNFLVDQGSGKLHLHAYAGIQEEEARRIEWLDYGVAVCATRDGHHGIAAPNAATTDPRAELVKGLGIQAYACHTLTVKGTVIGTLSFGTRSRPRFTPEETALMLAVADQVAIAMARQQDAEMLRTGEERLRLVLNASMMGTFEVDILSGEAHWNEVEFMLLGLTPGAVPASQEAFYRFIHPDDLAHFHAQWEEAMWSGKLDCEFRIIRADGEERWLAAKGRFVYAMLENGVAPAVARGQVAHFLGVNYDITERKRTEKELQELSLRLSYHVDNSPLAVIEWGPDMRLIRWSGAAERIFGWSADEVLGKRMEDFRWIHPEDAAQVAEVSCELRHGTDPRRFSTNRNFRKDGLVLQCEWYNSAMIDETGNFRSLLSLVLDVTERERAEEALRESESRLYTLANAMPQLAWIARADGYIFWYNQRWYDYTGTTPEQMAGWGWQEVHDPQILPEVLSQWRAALASGEPFAMEFPLRGGDGTFRQFLTRAYPVKDQQGEVVSWFGTNTDVSERKQAEERLAASLREKEVLLKEIHHRVKNNLQVISSLVDLQADSIDDPLLSGLFQDVRDRVRSMALVHEKLYCSENLDQVEFADYATSLLEYLWASYGSSAGDIRLTLDLHPLALSVEQAVPCGLIVNELVVNALKHAFSGHDPGEVTVALCRDQDGRATLSIGDTGVGLPEGMDWRQSESLGLRLVQMLSRQLAGTMAVESKAGTGTRFRLTFAPRGNQWT